MRLQSSDVFPSVRIGSQSSSDWQVVRQTANYQTTAPVEDVSSQSLTCYELNPRGHGAGVMNVRAGDSVCTSRGRSEFLFEITPFPSLSPTLLLFLCFL